MAARSAASTEVVILFCANFFPDSQDNTVPPPTIAVLGVSSSKNNTGISVGSSCAGSLADLLGKQYVVHSTEPLANVPGPDAASSAGSGVAYTLVRK